ncbi:hypothetical protein BRD20_00790 [Halobacteriales archaeon SW_8_65_20]|nr:MAG: hypothetical protein BRD20_00790 [Halobacteriales archaeon SW_8_65_20]
MERRKFLIGAGSLAAGAAAATGTGAFTDVSAQRTASVSVSDDSDAYLALKKDGNRNRAYADGSGTQMTVNLDGSDDTDGTGVNQGATTRIFDIFSIENRGTQEALVYVDNSDLIAQGAYDDNDDDGIYFDPQVSGMPYGRDDESLGELPDGTLYTSLTGIGGSAGNFAEEIFKSNSNVPVGPAVYLLQPGDQFDFGAYVRTSGDATTENVTYDMQVKASAALAQKARDEGMTTSQDS